MKNVVGKPAENDNFFPRKNIIQQIYRRLATGNIFMAAPRRSGKTSLMYHLRDNPQEGFVFVFINTEAVNDSEAFFRKVLLEVLDSEAVQVYKKTYEKSKGFFEKILKNVSKVKVFELEVELNNDNETTSFFEELKALVEGLDEKALKIVLLVDEFPTTIENIMNNHDKAEAINFLQRNRELRLLPSSAIRFIYTGSIGLPILVEKLGEPELINDLDTVAVTPLSEKEAKNFIQSIFTGEKIEISLPIIVYLIEKVNYLMPFYIQLMAQAMIDSYLDNPTDLTTANVDAAFKQITAKRKNFFFESYNNRLKETFPTEEELNIVQTILSRLSSVESLSYQDLFGEWIENRHHRSNKIILNTLESEGYIFQNQTNHQWQFISPILKNWWLQNVV